MVKLNNSNQYESVMIHLTPIDTPLAYAHRVEDLMIGGMTREAAEREALEPCELELYYEPGTALFGVDPGAAESGTIYSPYTGELCENAEES